MSGKMLRAGWYSILWVGVHDVRRTVQFAVAYMRQNVLRGKEAALLLWSYREQSRENKISLILFLFSRNFQMKPEKN